VLQSDSPPTHKQLRKITWKKFDKIKKKESILKENIKTYSLSYEARIRDVLKHRIQAQDGLKKPNGQADALMLSHC